MAGFDIKLVNAGVDIPLKLDTTRPGGIGPALTRQDVTPSNVAFKANLPGWDEMQPFSERTYEWLGGLGLLEQTDAPGDNNRHWIGDLTTSRARQIHAPIRRAGGTVTTSGSTPDINPYITTDATGGTGFIAHNSGGETHYYRWDGTNFVDIRRVIGPPAIAMVGGYTTRAVRSAQTIPAVEHDGKLWVSAGVGTGMYDANTAYVQTQNVGASNGRSCYGTQILGDTAFLFYATGTGTQMGIQAVDNAMVAINRDAELGAATITATVANVGHLLGMCSCDTSIYFCSDRQFFQMVYDENFQRIQVSALLSNPDTPITSAPVNYNGLVFFGCGARVAQYTPGDRKPQLLPVDAGNTVPLPWNGHITALYPTADALYAVIVNAAAAGTPEWAMLRMDGNGAWSTVYLDLGVTYTTAQVPLLRANENTSVQNPMIASIGYAASAAPQTYKLVPIMDGTRNPVYLASTYRQQETGKHYLIEPYEYGEVRASPKRSLQYLLEVADVTSTLPIKIWYQVDRDEDKANNYVVAGTPSAIPAGLVLSGRGQWTLGATLDNTTTGLTTVNGTSYAGFARFSLAGLSYPSFKALRLAIEITGDTTGTYLPRCRGLKHRYLEIPAKYYLWTARVRIEVADGQLGASAPQSAAAAGTTYDTILALCSAGTFVDLVDPKGGSRKVQLTKNVEVWREKDDGGLDPSTLPLAGTTTMRKFLMTISMQEIEEAAVA